MADVFGCLAVSEAGEIISMLGDEFSHRISIGLGVFAKGPSDCLADEKLLLEGPLPAEGEQPVGIGAFLGADLTDN